MAEIKIYQLSDKEVHMVGDYVGVCWNIRYREYEPQHNELPSTPGGLGITIKLPERTYGPYIDFVWVRENNGEHYEDEDSPVDGGIDKHTGVQIIQELEAAIAYIDSLT